MSQVHQLNLQYDPGEDRLLLRINTLDRAEYRFWLTRRYVRLLVPILLKAIESNEQVQSQPEPEARKTVMSFQHESALRTTDFKTVYREEPASLPLGEQGIVLAKAALKESQDGKRILCLHPAKGHGIELAPNDKLMHSLYQLLANTVAKAGWELEFRLPKPSEPSETAARSLN